MKLTVCKEFTFDAAHYLPGYDGPCKNMHGHTYRLLVGFRGPVNQETGMVVDFAVIKQHIESILDVLDHHTLNIVQYRRFPNYMPTAENMVKWLRGVITPPNSDAELLFVRLYETPTSYAEWYWREE